MKVTVSFGSVRVLVPCGAGDLLVRDLVREATLRYKKATGQRVAQVGSRPDLTTGKAVVCRSIGGTM
ncbi:hypothetical protein MSG28_003354 [Choristoneura fumiferana]|uniref:Uncharacterized protein n=1 Tax=Choristoneura fumiferana TaxID=7141 RepID=A0ACC0KEJ6_CHOFU|nr:hypothetical protein MSG28_003354 [Choristoneura fumiferana]